MSVGSRRSRAAGVVQGDDGGDRRRIVGDLTLLAGSVPVLGGDARDAGGDGIHGRFVVGADHQLVALEAVADAVADQGFDQGAPSVVGPVVEAVADLVVDLAFGQLGQVAFDQGLVAVVATAALVHLVATASAVPDRAHRCLLST